MERSSGAPTSPVERELHSDRLAALAVPRGLYTGCGRTLRLRNFPGFKNQGDCVSFVATGGKNLPPGS
jgi:hypothetical protein